MARIIKLPESMILNKIYGRRRNWEIGHWRFCKFHASYLIAKL